jgi:hypothetical protein
MEGISLGTLLGLTLFVLEGKAEGAMLTSVEGVALGCCDCVPLDTPSSSSKLGAFVETKLVLVGANDGSSVGGMVEKWSEGFDDGKSDGAGIGLDVPLKEAETVGETRLALAGDIDGSSVAGLVEMWSEGLDDGKPDGANDIN